MNMSPLSHLVQLGVGDTFDIGHRCQHIFTFSCNYDSHAVKKAFNAGTKIIGFSITDMCKNYQDNKISMEVYDALKMRGLLPKWIISDVEEFNEEPALDSETFALIYMATAKLGEPSLIYSMRRNPIVPIGGYGLFSEE